MRGKCAEIIQPLDAMYRAMYKYVGSDPGTLSFDVGDRFSVIEKTSSGWMSVRDGSGQTGYVPSNYLQPVEKSTCDIVQNQANVSSGKSNTEKLQDRKKLEIHRKNFAEEHQQLKQTSHQSVEEISLPENNHSTKGKSQELKVRRHAPLPPLSPEAEKLSVNTPAQAASDISRTKATAADAEDADAFEMPSTGESKYERGTKISAEQNLSRNDGQIPEFCTKKDLETNLDGLGHDLVEQIRRNTLLSYDKSKVAVSTVLTMLGSRIPQIKVIVETIMEEVAHNQGNSLEESNDALRLHFILKELVAAKDDSQQRSWFLHEDEAKICDHLKEMNSILEGANPETSRRVLEEDSYDVTQSLAQYYQMETRKSIRLLLLQTFGSVCGLGPRFISEFLNSVLPLELTRDIQNDLNDIQKLTYSALVLSMIFSTGEALPLQYYVHLNSSFVNYLLEFIEVTDQDVECEQVVDEFIRLILAFNLHFELPEENIVMRAFAERGTAKIFTEKILLMLNREVDPVKLFDHSDGCLNSVLKFVSDLYSCAATSNLFYTNDAKVLVDIIVRQLTDLSSGDKMRTEYLSLTHLLLKNSQYLEHRHHQTELQQCFQRISQEDKEAEMDKHIVQQIWKEFPDDFYNCL